MQENLEISKTGITYLNPRKKIFHIFEFSMEHALVFRNKTLFCFRLEIRKKDRTNRG